MYINLNGKVIKKEEAYISPFDHGYMYGLGVFETFRVYGGHPFLFNDHLKRLSGGLCELNIKLEIEEDKLLYQLKSLLEANQIEDAYVRLNVSAGIGDIGLQVDSYINPTTIMYMKPLPSEQSFGEKDAVILKIKRNSPEGSERLKSHHYLNSILGKREVGNDPKIEGIFLNDHGYLTEGVVSNLFWVKNDVVYTPSVDTGILNGITRQFVLELLKKINIEVAVGQFSQESLLDSEECFVTNSIQEIVPISSINGKKIGGEGRVTSTLIRIYNGLKRSLWTRDELRNVYIEGM